MTHVHTQSVLRYTTIKTVANHTRIGSEREKDTRVRVPGLNFTIVHSTIVNSTIVHVSLLQLYQHNLLCYNCIVITISKTVMVLPGTGIRVPGYTHQFDYA